MTDTYKEGKVATKEITDSYIAGIPIINVIDGLPEICTTDVEIIDLRARYRLLVTEKEKNSGDSANTYEAGYCAGHRDGQIELLQEILGVYDS